MIRKCVCIAICGLILSAVSFGQYNTLGIDLSGRVGVEPVKTLAFSGGAYGAFEVLRGSHKHDVMLLSSVNWTGDHLAAQSTGHNIQIEALLRGFQKEYGYETGLFLEGGALLDHQTFPGASIYRARGVAGAGFVKARGDEPQFHTSDLIIGRVDYLTSRTVRADLEYHRAAAAFEVVPRARFVYGDTPLGQRHYFEFGVKIGLNLTAIAGS